jgi:cell volume regulation protein A
MAVLLTIGIIQLITKPETTFGSVALLFIIQMGLGIVFGLGFGKVMVFMLNRLKSNYEGGLSVLSLPLLRSRIVLPLQRRQRLPCCVLMGLFAGNNEFVQKKSMMRFFDGLAWLSQITMFLT